MGVLLACGVAGIRHGRAERRAAPGRRQTLHTRDHRCPAEQTENAVRYLYWLRRCAGRSGLGHALRSSAEQPELRAALAAFALWLAYVSGAIGGGFASHRWGLPALAVPVAVLSALIVTDLVRPRADGSR